jgi:hypothetical protein
LVPTVILTVGTPIGAVVGIASVLLDVINVFAIQNSYPRNNVSAVFTGKLISGMYSLF